MYNIFFERRVWYYIQPYRLLMKKKSLEEVEAEIYEKRQNVRYDVRDMTVEALVNKYQASIIVEETGDNDIFNYIYIPDYQRDFTWDEERQSKLIESLLLGLPIPFIFVAENKDSSWEIVDGSQRIRTLHSFVNNRLLLNNLKSISSLNGYKFNELEPSRRGKLLNTALRIIVLSEETTEEAKKDMFERINRGSDLLKPMEKRKGIYTGPFCSFIYEYCNTNEQFKKLVLVDKWLEKRQEREELLLRFFAIVDKKAYLKGINGSISSFLDDYLNEKNIELSSYDENKQEAVLHEYSKRIDAVVNYVDQCFPYGFRHAHNPQTKRSVFEAISVGVWLALDDDKALKHLSEERILTTFKSETFRKYTHVASELHKKEKLKGRIEVIYQLVTGTKESLK